jgi:ABC-type molybdate transport system substrate-binding protein
VSAAKLRAAIEPRSSARPVRIYAAGSLKAAFSEIAAELTAIGGARIHLTFGAAGLLKDRIAGGEVCDLFASANTAHPRALAHGRPVTVFARNRICAIAAARLGATADNLLQLMLHPSVRVGMSTPGADPSGDYALGVFRKADDLAPGAGALLAAKALALTGAPAGSKPKSARSVYSEIMASAAADIFLTYVTNARIVLREVAEVSIVELPAELAISAEYGLISLSERRESTQTVTYILSRQGQDVLARHGFETVAGHMKERWQ